MKDGGLWGRFNLSSDPLKLLLSRPRADHGARSHDSLQSAY